MTTPEFKRPNVAAPQIVWEYAMSLERWVINAETRVEEARRLASSFARFYDAVDEAEKIDTNAGDSAVSVVLWSWAQERKGLDEVSA